MSTQPPRIGLLLTVAFASASPRIASADAGSAPAQPAAPTPGPPPPPSAPPSAPPPPVEPCPAGWDSVQPKIAEFVKALNSAKVSQSDFNAPPTNCTKDTLSTWNDQFKDQLAKSSFYLPSAGGLLFQDYASLKDASDFRCETTAVLCLNAAGEFLDKVNDGVPVPALPGQRLRVLVFAPLDGEEPFVELRGVASNHRLLKTDTTTAGTVPIEGKKGPGGTAVESEAAKKRLAEAKAKVETAQGGDPKVMESAEYDLKKAEADFAQAAAAAAPNGVLIAYRQLRLAWLHLAEEERKQLVPWMISARPTGVWRSEFRVPARAGDIVIKPAVAPAPASAPGSEAPKPTPADPAPGGATGSPTPGPAPASAPGSKAPESPTLGPDEANARIDHLFLDTGGRNWSIPLQPEVYHVDFGVLLPVWTANVRNATREMIPGTTERRFAQEDSTADITPKVAIQFYPAGHCSGAPYHPRLGCWLGNWGAQLAATPSFSTKWDDLYVGTLYEVVDGLGLNFGIASLKQTRYPDGLKEGDLVPRLGAPGTLPTDRVWRAYVGFSLSLELFKAWRAAYSDVEQSTTTTK